MSATNGSRPVVVRKRDRLAARRDMTRLFVLGVATYSGIASLVWLTQGRWVEASVSGAIALVLMWASREVDDA